MGQNPHGEELTMDCAFCHTADSWTIEIDSIQFNHNTTDFYLEGTHNQVDCKLCHPTLVFNEASSDCISCHDDVHSMTVGNDCVRCHTSETWLIDNIPELHEENGFPLIGAHSSLSCDECHISDTYLRFDRLGNECINCHQDDYLATTNPNHQSAGYSTECLDCHNPLGFGWEADVITHGFFPLTLGHDIQDCKECHISDNFSDASPECVSCHQDDYNSTTNPNHQSAGFSTNCILCHTADIDWIPASFNHDDQFFPIYSGEHEGEWNDCIDCHNNPNNYAEFTCIGCHINPETNEEHNGVDGYVYESNACLACHPTGKSGEAFDHNTTNFMLTGGHFGIDCIECHANGYVGTSMLCNDCHNADFLATSNPNHNAIGISTDCISCHTTDPGWTPATFTNHNDYYPLNGAHALIANECATCHNGDYTNTPNTCVACHQTDFDNTTDPNHVASQFPTDCASCHGEDDWIPASFDHNTTNFALTGGHFNIDCLECHSNGYTGTSTLCNDCHNDTYTSTSNPNHNAIGISTDCVTCHTTDPGWIPASFDVHDDYYQLNGAHALIATDCATCHNGDYTNTVNTCVGCHQADYDGTTDPNHSGAGFNTDCITCHNESAWDPSTFDHDGQFFEINSGTHQGEWNDCATCHTNQNNFAEYTCFSCHDQNVLNAIDDHEASTEYAMGDCTACHQ